MVETRYYISSLKLGVKQFARAVRSHWSIENSCLWSLDVTDCEDDFCIRDQHGRENFAWLNRFTLSLLKQHPGKDSLAIKRRMCGWNDDDLLQVLTGATNSLPLALGALVSTHFLASLEGQKLTSELFEWVEIMVRQQFQHREQCPQSGQERGGGLGRCRFI